MSLRERLIAAGVIRPRTFRPPGDPSPERERDTPTLRLDRIAIGEAKRLLDGPRWADPSPEAT